MELVVPSLTLALAFFVFLEDFYTNDIDNIESYLLGKDDFSLYIQSVTDEHNGINLREGYVPCSWPSAPKVDIFNSEQIFEKIASDFN